MVSFWLHLLCPIQFAVQTIHVFSILVQVRVDVFVCLKGAYPFVLEELALFFIREARL